MTSLYRRTLADGKTVWYAKIKYPDGRRKSHNTQTSQKKEATKIAQYLQHELDRGRDPFANAKGQDSPTIHSLVEEYLEERQHQWGERTGELHQHTLKIFMEVVGNLQLKAITKKHVSQFQAALIKRGARNRLKKRLRPLSKHTLNIHLRNLRAFLNWCVRENDLEEWNPPHIHEVRVPAQVNRDYYKPDEVRRLLEAAESITQNGVSIRTFLVVLSLTGMRRNEARSLEWFDTTRKVISSNVGIVDLDAEQIILAAGITKSKRGRRIPILPVLKKELLNAFPEPRKGKLFPGIRHDVSIKFNRARDAAGLRSLKMHNLRDTFAVNMLLSGVPLIAVKQILGHSSIQTTIHNYAGLLDMSDLKQALRKASTSELSTILSTKN